MRPAITVTTSWDDGHVLDLRLAELLNTYRLPATFYISPDNREFKPADRLSPEQVRQLGANFEIGAHTLTHPRLTTITGPEAESEITQSKHALESIIARPVDTFCYPGGDFNSSHLPLVRSAGYKYARTITRFKIEVGPDPLRAPTTIHAYRHWSDIIQILRLARFHPLKFMNYLLNWDALAIHLFERTRLAGGIFHLWGHSWEIENNHDWARLERVFAHISRHPDIQYRTNGELV